MRTCRYCKKELPIDCFNIDRSRRDGHRRTCKFCDNVYSKAYYSNHRAQSTETAKMRIRRNRRRVITYLGGKCAKCGNNDWRVLEIDHKNNDGNRERLASDSWHRLILSGRRDINDLQLLCGNCHNLKRYEGYEEEEDEE